MKRSTAPRHQREETRTKLVEAALRVFALQGYDHATVEEVSLAAGYSKGAYYFHFDSKEGIFLELLSAWAEEQSHRLRPLEKPGPTAALTLIRTLESLLRYDDRDTHWHLLLPEFWAQSYQNEAVLGVLRKAYEHWLQLLANAFDKAEKDGLLTLRVKSDVAASLVLATHDGLIVRSRLTDDGDMKLTQVLGTLISTVVSLSEPDPPSPPPVMKRTTTPRR